MSRNKAKTSFTISRECKELLDALAAKMGTSRTGVIEILVREKALEEHHLVRAAFEYRAMRETVRDLIEQQR